MVVYNLQERCFKKSSVYGLNTKIYQHTIDSIIYTLLFAVIILSIENLKFAYNYLFHPLKEISFVPDDFNYLVQWDDLVCIWNAKFNSLYMKLYLVRSIFIHQGKQFRPIMLLACRIIASHGQRTEDTSVLAIILNYYGDIGGHHTSLQSQHYKQGHHHSMQAQLITLCFTL